MSLNKDTLQLIIDNARAAAEQEIQTSAHRLAVLPESVKLVNLEQYQAGRDRLRGSLHTHALADFCKHVSAQATAKGAPANGARGFIDQDAMAATVIFNLGDQEEPGHGDHTATLKLKPTAAYAALLGINGKQLSQQALAEFLEDWAPHMQAYCADDEPLTIAAAINGIRRMTIKASSQRDSVVSNMSASSSAMDQIEARSQETLPTAFTFNTVPFEGLKPAHILLRLSVLTGGEVPALKLRWVGEEAQREEFAREFQGVLNNEVGGLVPLTIGTYTVGK